MHPTIIAIDPGISGAVCTLNADGPFVSRVPTRVLSNGRVEVDSKSLYDMLSPADLAVIEEVNGDPKFGGSRAFNFGKSFGQALSLLQVMFPPANVVRVRPQRWKKELLGPGKHTKEDSIAFVRSFYPFLDLVPPGGWKPSHDLAEAVCLARWGLLELQSRGE